MSQAEVFLAGEGDRYHERNRNAELNASVVNAILSIGFRPNAILEIGCGDGRYLHELYQYYGGRCVGVDPSSDAIAEGKLKYPEIELICTDAKGITDRSSFDLIVFGFCLYLMDRQDLFYLVYQFDWHLKDGGYLAIHDFDPEYPQVSTYKHRKGIYSYKMDYPSLWLANPGYRKITKAKTGEGTAITILQKHGWGSLCES